MIPVVLYLNGVRRAGQVNWPAVPRTGESMELVGGPGTFKVVRVMWAADGNTLVAHVFLKHAFTQL